MGCKTKSNQTIFFFFFLQLEPFGCHGNQSNSLVWTKLICLVDYYLRNIPVKHLSKRLCCEIEINVNFHFSHYVSRNFNCHSNQSSYPIGTKNTIIRSPGLYACYVKFGKNRLQGFRGDVVWKCWRTMDRWMSAYLRVFGLGELKKTL